MIGVRVTHGMEKLEDLSEFLNLQFLTGKSQCWTEGRSSTAVAEDLRPMATAMVAKV